MGLMQSGHMRRLAVHCRAPEEEHVYADRIVEQATYFGISTDAAVVEIKSLLGAGDDSRAGQNIAGLPCAFPGWSIVVRCVLLSALSGPVAQRLEKGSHNLVSFLLLRARAPEIVREQARPQTTISGGGIVNMMSTTRVEQNGNDGKGFSGRKPRSKD